MKVFLGGAIQYLSENATALATMQHLVDAVSAGLAIHCVEVSNAHIVEDFGNQTHAWNPHSIAQRDFEWMKNCDVFVAFLVADEVEKITRTDGTHVEIGWATSLSKRTLLVVDGGPLKTASDLLRGLLNWPNVSAYSLEQAVRTLEQLVAAILQPAPDCELDLHIGHD